MPNPVNSVTDQLDMVNTTTVHGGTWLFPKSVRADMGFSQQVFKASGEYRGSVDDPNAKIAVRDGDFVLRVNMGIKELPLKGTLHTRDGYSRAYEGTVLIQVTNPARFAIAYRQGVDPAGHARTLIDGDLTRWALGMKHEEIAQEMLRFRARHALLSMGPMLGLEVASAEKLIAYADPIIAERIRIEHEDQITIAKHEIEVRQNQEGRIEHSKDRALARNEAAQDELMKFKVEENKRVVTTVLDVQVQQLRDLLDQGYTLEQINAERPDLLRTISTFANLSPQDAAALAAGAADAGNNLLPGGMSGSSGGFGAIEPAAGHPSGAEVRSDRLGVWLQAVALDADQQATLSTPPIAVTLAYKIIRVDQDGPAVRANLIMGDILVQVNGQPLSSPGSVDTLLRPHSAENAQAWVLYVRGAQTYQAAVAVAA